MKYSANKEINGIVKQLVKQGWEFYWGSKHGRIKHPSGSPIITVPKTPSDWRSAVNFNKLVNRSSSNHKGISLSGQQSGGIKVFPSN